MTARPSQATLVALAALTLGAALARAGDGAAPELLDPAARLPQGDAAQEHWDLTVQLDSGYFVWARFLITNVGPGSGHGLTIGCVVTPSGGIFEFREGKLAGAWELAADRRAADIRRAHFSFRPPLYTVAAEEKDVSLRLEFAPNGREPTPAGVAPDHLHYEVLALASSARGEVWVEGLPGPIPMQGRAALIHSWSDGAEWDVVLRRIEFFSMQGDVFLKLVDFATPKGERTHWLSLTDSHGTTFSETDFQLELSGAKKLEWKPRYWVPEWLRVESPRATGEIHLKGLLMEHDPLGDIPQPFRFIVSLSMKPHRVWAQAGFEVTLRPSPTGDTREYRGSGVAAVTFLNPVLQP